MPDTLIEPSSSHLPNPVQRWLRLTGAMDKPLIQSGHITQEAEMRLKPGQTQWLKATAVQFTNIDEPGFIWKAKVRLNPLVFFTGRDTFMDGKAQMQIKLLSLVYMVNARGEKLNEAALQRFLAEMMWFPSLALSPFITWEPIDEHTAKSTMSYKGTTGSGTFYFKPDGEVTRFSAMRYKDHDANARRYEWVVDILAHKSFQGISVPSKLTLTWKLDNMNWTWMKMEVTDIRYNDTPEA